MLRMVREQARSSLLWVLQEVSTLDGLDCFFVHHPDSDLRLVGNEPNEYLHAPLRLGRFSFVIALALG